MDKGQTTIIAVVLIGTPCSRRRLASSFFALRQGAVSGHPLSITRRERPLPVLLFVPVRTSCDPFNFRRVVHGTDTPPVPHVQERYLLKS